MGRYRSAHGVNGHPYMHATVENLLSSEEIPEILVIGRDEDDFAEHIGDLSEQDAEAFIFVLVDHPAMIRERIKGTVRIHVTRNAKLNPLYHIMLLEISLLNPKHTFRVLEWKHDVPTAFEPEAIERWLAE